MNKKQKITARYPEEIVMVACEMWASHKLYDDVLAECGIDKADKARYNSVRRILKDGVSKRIMFAIHEAIEGKHLEHLDSFVNSSLKANPEITYETILMKFAMLYPDIRERVFDALQTFFDNFVENYKKVFK